jgi:hypothetical protein
MTRRLVVPKDAADRCVDSRPWTDPWQDPKSSSRRTKRAIVGRPDVDADLYHFPAHERVRGTAPERR